MAQFNDLNDYCLLEVLDLLSPEELFKMLGVNRRLKRLAADKIQTKIKAITLNPNKKCFSVCTHLGISLDQALVLGPMFKLQNVTNNFLDPSKRALFLNVLTICAGVKSIDFNSFNLSDGFLVKVVELCPEIECLKLDLEYVRKEELDQMMDRIGHRLVHIGKSGNAKGQSEARLLAMVAEKCPNIKKIDWYVNGVLTSDLVAAFKLLPKSCWITLECSKLEVFEDVVDEFEVYTLDWFKLGHRLDRLSSLKFTNLGLGWVRSVDFTNLRKLEYDAPKCWTIYLYERLSYDDEEKNILLFSQFPRLEEFHFNASRGFTEDDYQELFQRMTSVKKLTMICEPIVEYDIDVPIRLPGSSINQLNKLETIEIKTWYIPEEWQPEDFLKLLEAYVDDIGSLKKLSVELLCGGNHEWENTVEDKIKRLKMEKNRVEMNLIRNNLMTTTSCLSQ